MPLHIESFGDRSMSVTPRFNRLFGPDGKCFDVAIDHGFFNEFE